jgi:nudix-type nucleoside diphosphatase (YffH/AdpP family)
MSHGSPSVIVEEKSAIAKGKGVLTKVVYRFRNRHGEWKDNTREVYDNGNSAVVLPYDPDRRTILLTRQLRIPAFLQDGKETILEACAGKLEGEAPEQRMVREIEEELGYRIDHLDRLFELYMSPAAVMEKITFFTCSYSPADQVSAGGGLADEGEDIEVVEIELEKAVSMIGTGQIVDAKTVILLQYLGHRSSARSDETS